MSSVRHLVALAALTLVALPHSFVRGKAPSGKSQYYVCDKEGCPDYTRRRPDPRNPQHCAKHGREMKYPAYER